MPLKKCQIYNLYAMHYYAMAEWMNQLFLTFFFCEFAIECDHDIDLLEKNHDVSDSVVPKNCLERAKK